MSRKAKNYVYVGGLDESIAEEFLHSAFIPFGDIKSVQIVRDFVASSFVFFQQYICDSLSIELNIDKSRGFGFVEFELDEDAAEAIDNMDGAELFGKVLKCDRARPPTTSGQAGKALWNTEEFLKSSAVETEEQTDDQDNTSS